MKWRYRPAPPLKEMNQWIEDLGFLPLFAAGLWARGFCDRTTLERFFRPHAEDLLNPAMFGVEMEKAVARLRSAFENKEKIVILGDYDVDGTTGAALIQGVFQRLAGHYGFSSTVMLSDRFTEGYGLNAKNLDRLISLQPKLVVTVDCGVSSGNEIAQLIKAGIDVIITDHHGLKGDYPSAAVAVVHPGLAIHGEVPPISGCCVAWLLMRGLWELHAKSSPEWLMRDSLDLVALGAVCDIMPLNITENRFFVQHGMRQIEQGSRIAFRVMRECCKWRKVSTYTLGFVIGPRINAAGRMNKTNGAEPVVEWLLSQDESRCAEIVQQLEQYNMERRREQEDSIAAGLAQLADGTGASYQNISVVQGDFHEGVVGIVASKLAEKFNRPAFVMATTDSLGEKGLMRGSARSIPGIDLFKLIERHQKHLSLWGGHSMAAGLNIDSDQMEGFFRALDADLGVMPAEIWEKVRWVDGKLSEADLTANFFANLTALEPHGEKFSPFIWELSGRITRGRILERQGNPKVGTLVVDNRSFPFAMWDNAEQVDFEQERTFYGSWEYNDYQKSMQFRAIGLA